MTFSIVPLGIESRYADCRDYLNLMLNAVVLSVAMLNVVVPGVVAPGAKLPVRGRNLS